MKQLVMAWLGVVALGFVLAGSCVIDHRSGAFECTKQADCDPPRTCVDGLCVKPGGTTDARPIDAKQIDALDAFECPDQCTSCDPGRKECTIDCAGGADCNSQVTCPEGWNCVIRCNTSNSCRNGIDCKASESCVVLCTGSQACRDLACGPGPCTVNCSGGQSCRNMTCGSGPCSMNCTGNQACDGIMCGESCACDVMCGNLATCANVQCTGFFCFDGRGCSSSRPGCETCP